MWTWWTRWRRAWAPSTVETDPENVDDEDDDARTPDEVRVCSDELDLHSFIPREVADAVTEYLEWAAAHGLTEVRIIHGKGIGSLRRTVHATLARHPRVAGFRLADDRRGGWGATLVTLRTGEPG